METTDLHTPRRRTRRLRHLALATVLVAAPLVAVEAAPAGAVTTTQAFTLTASGTVTVTRTSPPLTMTGTGTMSPGGAVTYQGKGYTSGWTAVLKVNATDTLTIRVTPPPTGSYVPKGSPTVETWSVVAGTGKYLGATGSGTGKTTFSGTTSTTGTFTTTETGTIVLRS